MLDARRELEEQEPDDFSEDESGWEGWEEEDPENPEEEQSELEARAYRIA